MVVYGRKNSGKKGGTYHPRLVSKAIISKSFSDPVVDLVESQFLLDTDGHGQADESCVGVGWLGTHILTEVQFL